MAKASTVRAQKKRLHSLYGGMVASRTAQNRALVRRKRAFTADFKRQEAVAARHAAEMRRIHAPMLAICRRDPAFLQSVQRLRALSVATVKRKLSPPRVPLHKPRIVADLGATVVAPYNFEEVLFSSTGTPPNASSAVKSSGTITSSIGFNFNNASSASVSAGVGIFFHPPTDCPGTLKISSSVAFSFDWSTYCAFAGAHSDGWIGLAVEQFDLNGFPTGMLIDQKIILWSDDSWWGGAGSFSGSNSGFPLFAQCTVDSQHSYHVWVRCGGRVSSAGWGGWFGSGAGSRIIGTVPSIAWELV